MAERLITVIFALNTQITESEEPQGVQRYATHADLPANYILPHYITRLFAIIFKRNTLYTYRPIPVYIYYVSGDLFEPVPFTNVSSRKALAVPI